MIQATETYRPFRLCEIGNREGEPITRDEALTLLANAWPEFPGFWREDELHCLATGAEEALTIGGSRWIEVAI